MRKLQALIFDVDGTLAETERDGHRLAFNQAFADFGLDWQWDVATYGALLAVTGGKERMLAYWQQRDPQAAAKPDAPALIAQLHRRKTAHYVRLVESGALMLRPGVARLLDEAEAHGLKLAIATTTTVENVVALLEATLGQGSAARFAAIGAGDIVPRKKPDPGIYLWVLEQLRLEAGDCLAFEDSRAGWSAADGAGLATIVTSCAYTADESFPEARAWLNGLGEPQAPARGYYRGAPWSGMVTVPLLETWCC
ncbi:MAG: HAD family hydrolase [Acidocella sp.]|nr:HAD family hydrolase [Acidocella sp.]